MLSERVEDYLEAIDNVHNRKGYVRVKDVANTLSITCPSVTEMLKKLVTSLEGEDSLKHVPYAIKN